MYVRATNGLPVCQASPFLMALFLSPFVDRRLVTSGHGAVRLRHEPETVSVTQSLLIRVQSQHNNAFANLATQTKKNAPESLS